MIFIAAGYDVLATVGPVKQFVHHAFPFGLAALASILETKGVPVVIVNDAITPLTVEKIRSLAAQEPGRPVFGISSLTVQAHRSKQLHRLIKQAVPAAVTIVGGIHATTMPDEFLDAGFDYVFAGEAEPIITELATGLMENKDVSHIPGLMWKDRQGTVQRNPCSLERIDLAKLPPFPFHLFHDDLPHYDLGVIMSSRGCPYKCIFCSQRTMTGLTYRSRPTAMVLDEVGTLIDKYAVRHICFFDDNLVVNRQRALELCDGLISRGLHRKATFFGQLRGDAATSEILDKLVQAGFEGVSIGVETGSERMATIIQKGETVEANRKAVYLAKQKGLRVAATFIIGFPGETAQDRTETIRFALSLPLDAMRVNIAIPYPGTPLYEMTKDRLHIAEGWKNFNVVSPLVTGPFHALPLPYVPDGTTQNELRYLMISTNLGFWLRPSGIKKFFMSPTTGVTSLEKRWLLKPAALWAVARLGGSVMLLGVWLVGLAVQHGVRRFRRVPATNSEAARSASSGADPFRRSS